MVEEVETEVRNMDVVEKEASEFLKVSPTTKSVTL